MLYSPPPYEGRGWGEGRIEMKYPTKMSAVVKVWHPSLAVREIERAIGRSSSISHQVGERRTRGDKAPYHDTYCAFDLVSSRVIDSVDLIRKCLGILVRRKAALSTLLGSGGKAVLSVRLEDREFVQFYMEPAQLTAFATLGAGLVFE